MDSFAFGKPARYLQLIPPSDVGDWDAALDRSASVYPTLAYNILTNNCHQARCSRNSCRSCVVTQGTRPPVSAAQRPAQLLWPAGGRRPTSPRARQSAG